MPYIECIGGKGNKPTPTPLKPSQVSLMRKIERLMNAAITAGKDFKLDNTEVVSCSHVSDVYLHGNLIARIGETWIELFDGGWQSNTTKSRLNAILSEHGIPGEGIFQKNYQWFFKSNDYGVIPFFSGMRIAWDVLSWWWH